MQETSQISEFGKILVFLLLGTLMIMSGYAINYLLSKSKPNPIKNSTYECGEETVGNSWVQFNMRFYVIALVFLLFEVEMIFIFPWATVFAERSLIEAIPSWGVLSLAEMFIFIGILLIGLMYVWRKGDLNWIRPQNIPLSSNTSIPYELYEKINTETYKVRPFAPEPELIPVAVTPVEQAPGTTDTVAPPAARRPPFRSAVKKTGE